jgi:hypothetical protein
MMCATHGKCYFKIIEGFVIMGINGLVCTIKRCIVIVIWSKLILVRPKILTKETFNIQYAHGGGCGRTNRYDKRCSLCFNYS